MGIGIWKTLNFKPSHKSKWIKSKPEFTCTSISSAPKYQRCFFLSRVFQLHDYDYSGYIVKLQLSELCFFMNDSLILDPCMEDIEIESNRNECYVNISTPLTKDQI